MPENIQNELPEQIPTSAGFKRQMNEIEVLIRARYPLIYVISWEEQRVLAVYVSRLQFLIESRLNTPDVIAQKETKIKEIENSINDLCSFCNEYYKSVSGNYVKNHPVQKISPEHSSQGGAVSIGKKLSSTVAELRNILGRIEQISESLISSESGQQQQ